MVVPILEGSIGFCPLGGTDPLEGPPGPLWAVWGALGENWLLLKDIFKVLCLTW